MPGTLYARLRARRRLLVSDVDGTLLEGAKAGRGCSALAERLHLSQAALVLATGRDLALTLEATQELMAAGLPRPEALICSVGSEIYLGEANQPDERWADHIADGWDGDAVRRALSPVVGLEPQDDEAQRRYKASYFFAANGTVDGGERPTPPRVSVERAGDVTAAAASALAAAGLQARLIASAGSFLDVLPAKASKGAAVNWLISMAAFDPRGVVVAGDSGNDREMLLTRLGGEPLRAVVVGNREPELDDIADQPNVYLAERFSASGVLEGLLAHGW